MTLDDDKVECSVCEKMRSRRRSRGVYVGNMGVQYVCFSCRKLPFNDVMDAIIDGKVYLRGTIYRSLAEMERANNERNSSLE